jgi:uncharacterized protein involved in outer membrane biogenesis
VSRARRALLLALAAVVAVVLLFTVVFPWVDENLVNNPVLVPTTDDG